MPNLYVIAGCNGAGKTTTSYTVLPEMLQCKEFVNADEIAKGLSPFQPETVSFQAGRIMLSRIKELLTEKLDFGFETTLSTRSYLPILNKAKESGYRIILIFFWLESPELAKARVKSRVEKGGHHIGDLIIERRYYRGLSNFFSRYSEVSDFWMFYDNSGEKPKAIAKGHRLGSYTFNNELWNKIKESNEYNRI
jgi:predicted ABC-type ATPase